MDCIKFDYVTKSYGSVVAINDVSFAIPCGERYALIGPNGAGKSTIMKLAVGLLSPNTGKVSIKGFPPDSVEARKIVGYLPEDAVPYMYLTVRENLEYIATLRGLTDPKDIADRLINELNLEEYEKTLVVKLSRGNRQKLAVALAIMHSPEVLLLDEPLNYLDIPTQEKVISLLASMNSTFLVATHIMSVATRLTRKVLVINHGKVIWHGTMEELRKLGSEDEPIESIVARVMNNSN